MPEEIPHRPRSSANMGWRGDDFQAAGPANAARQRRFWSVLLTGLLVGLVGLVIFLVLLPRSTAETFLLTIHIGEYKNEGYPVVPFVMQDSLRLQRHFDMQNKKDAETKTEELLVQGLRRLDDVAGGRPLIVHIAALGQVSDGKVFLLPSYAKPDEPANWVPVDRVLELVGKYKAPKLLILDLAHPLADAKLGVLSDRVAEVLQTRLAQQEPPFWVFLPCSQGQFSLTSETLRGSVFASYLDKGLAGEADGFNPDGYKDEKIAVDELFAYVEFHVERWASVNGQQAQKPLKRGKGENFTLVNLNRSFQPEPYKSEAPPYPEALKRGFAVRDAWSKRGDIHLPPARVRALEAELLRQEQRWRGGYELQPLDLAQTAELELKKIGTAKRAACPTLSLAASAPDAALDPKFLEAVGTFLETVPEGLGKEAELAKLKPAFAKILQEKIKEKEAGYFQKARSVVEGLASLKNIHSNQVRLAVDALESKQIGKPPGRRFVEPFYLQRLATYADGLLVQGLGLRWRSPVVHQELKTMTACESAVVALSRDPALLLWVKPWVEKGDDQRRAGEKEMFGRLPSEGAPVEKLRLAEESYKQAVGMFDVLQRSRRVLDEALVLLPGYQPLLSEWPEFDQRAVDHWHKAANAARHMDEFFKLQDPAADPFGHLDKQRIALEGHVNVLTDTLKQRIERADSAVAIDKDGKATLKGKASETAEQLQGLLRCRLLDASLRVKLSQKLNALAAELQSRTDKQEADKTPLPKQARGWEPLNQALVRARLSLAMLSLNNPDAGRLEQDLLPRIRGLDQLVPLEKGLLEAWSRRGAEPSAQKNSPLFSRQKQCREYISWMASRYRREVTSLESGENGDSKEARSFYSYARREFEQLENTEP